MTTRSTILTFLFLVSVSAPSPAQDLKKVRFSGYAQGTTYRITYLEDDSLSWQEEIEKMLDSIDRSLSLYRPGSLISRFNEHPRGMVMDRFMREVVEKSLEISRQSEGAFDITIKPLMDLWGFGVKRHRQVPDSAVVQEALTYTGYRLLDIRGDSLIKKDPRVQIDAGGIAQGYAVDVLAELLEEKGVLHYLVELGGEIRTRGYNDQSEKWKIGIEKPAEGQGNQTPLEQIIALSGPSIAVSGDYRNFYESGGKHYTHHIDPHTGRPKESLVISVAVIAPDCMTADALGNVPMILGIEQSLSALRQFPGVSAFFIFKDACGDLQTLATEEFKKYLSADHQKAR